MAVRMYGHLIVQGTAPAESPVMVGTLWADTSAGQLKQCTSVSPYTFVTIGGTGAGGVGDVVGPASSTDGALARFDGLTGKLLKESTGIVNADVDAAAGIVWSKLSTTGSSLADLTTRSATDLTSGTLPDARFPATLPAASGANLTALNATQLTSGTVPLARVSGLTNTEIAAAAAIDFSKLSDTVIFRGVSSPTTTGDVTGLTSTGIHTYRFNNATDVTIHGIAAGVQGQRIRFISVGAGNVYFSHQSSTEGTAANRLINFATVGTTPLAAGTGTAEFEYDGTTGRWRLVNHVQGAWISVPYAAGNFTGNGSMTWGVDAGDVSVYQYYLAGRQMSLSLVTATTDVGGTANTSLQVLIPGGHTAAVSVRGIAIVSDAGAATAISTCLTTAGAPTVVQFRTGPANANWTLTTGDNTTVVGSIAFPVN